MKLKFNCNTFYISRINQPDGSAQNYFSLNIR